MRRTLLKGDAVEVAPDEHHLAPRASRHARALGLRVITKKQKTPSHTQFMKRSGMMRPDGWDAAHVGAGVGDALNEGVACTRLERRSSLNRVLTGSHRRRMTFLQGGAVEVAPDEHHLAPRASC